MRHFYTVSAMAEDALSRYPLGRDGAVRTPGGLPLDELQLDDPRVTADWRRRTPDTPRLQADVADASAPLPLAANRRRPAEPATVPQTAVRDLYPAVRPRRSSAVDLEAWAARLKDGGAVVTAAFVREA